MQISSCIDREHFRKLEMIVNAAIKIYCALLCNVYGGARGWWTYQHIYNINIILYTLRTFVSFMWGSLRLAPIITSGPMYIVLFHLYILFWINVLLCLFDQKKEREVEVEVERERERERERETDRNSLSLSLIQTPYPEMDWMLVPPVKWTKNIYIGPDVIWLG